MDFLISVPGKLLFYEGEELAVWFEDRWATQFFLFYFKYNLNFNFYQIIALKKLSGWGWFRGKWGEGEGKKERGKLKRVLLWRKSYGFSTQRLLSGVHDNSSWWVPFFNGVTPRCFAIILRNLNSKFYFHYYTPAGGLIKTGHRLPRFMNINTTAITV